MSSQDRQGSLIASVEHSISYQLITKLPIGQKNILEPLKLVTPEGVSLNLAFHSITYEATSKYYNLDFHIEDVVICGHSLEIDVSLQTIQRAAGANMSTDRNTWPAPQPVVKKTLTESGLAGSVLLTKTTHVTVKVEVFSLTPSLPSAILAGLNEARVQSRLPDVVLTLGGDEFPAHRAVLVATSPVFLKMFTGDYKEAKALKKTPSGDLVCEVPISGVSNEAVELFLTLMYMGHADDWNGLEVELLELSDYYLVSTVKQQCEARLLGILRQADNPVISSDVRVRAVQAVLQGWKQLSISPLWRDLQRACPVLADAIRAAHQLYEPRRRNKLRNPGVRETSATVSLLP